MSSKPAAGRGGPYRYNCGSASPRDTDQVEVEFDSVLPDPVRRTDTKNKNELLRIKNELRHDSYTSQFRSHHEDLQSTPLQDVMPETRMRIEEAAIEGEGPSQRLQGKDDLGKIRQDVSALGFAGVEDRFQPGKVLCLFKFEALSDGDFVEIYFLHEEGMACLVGVGLANSVITLRANSDHIYVREVGEETWMRMWTMENSTSTPILFREPTSSFSFGEGGTSTHSPGTEETEVNIKEASNSYSYEDGPEATVKGTGLSMLKGRSLLHRLTREILQSKLEAANQRSTRHLGQTSCKPAGDSSGVNNTGTRNPWSRPPRTGQGSGLPQPLTSDSSHIEMKKASGQPAQVTTDDRQGEEGTDKFLTVEVTLNPEHNKIMDPETKQVKYDVGASDGVHHIGIVMTVKFFYQQSPRKNELEVSLESKFDLESIEQKDKNSTGWWQDHLISSFQCLDDSDIVCIDSGIRTPLMYHNRDLVTSTQTTESEGTGHSLSAGISGGVPHAAASAGYGFSKTKAGSKSVGMQTAASFPVEVLDQSMFAIYDEGHGKVMKYHAAVLDPVDKQKMLEDEVYRNRARDGRLLSRLKYIVWGRWKLCTTPGQPMYEYQVTVQRKLFLATLREAENSKEKRSSWLNWLGSSNTKSNIELATRELLQQLTRKFLISHVFDHTDYRSEKYEWEMKSRRRCPVPTHILKEPEFQRNIDTSIRRGEHS